MNLGCGDRHTFKHTLIHPYLASENLLFLSNDFSPKLETFFFAALTCINSAQRSMGEKRFPLYSKLYSKTLCPNPKGLFSKLGELGLIRKRPLRGDLSSGRHLSQWPNCRPGRPTLLGPAQIRQGIETNFLFL